MHKCKRFVVPEGFGGRKNFLRAEGSKKISLGEPATFFTYIYTFEHLHYTNTTTHTPTVALSACISLVPNVTPVYVNVLVAMFSQM